MLMLIMQLPPGSSKYRICPFITEKTVLSGSSIQVEIDKLCRVRATTQCAFGVSWSNPRAVGLVQKKLYFQSLSATSDSRAKFEPSSLSSPGQVYHTTSKSEGGMDPFIHECMNGSIGSGSNGQYAFSAPLTDSKGSGAEQKVISRVYVSVLFL